MIWSWLYRFESIRADWLKIPKLAALAVLHAACSYSQVAFGAEVEEVGIDPVQIGQGPFVYETAEQKDIQVDVIARGLSRGYSLAFLPNGDALIVERGSRMRLLRNATGPKPELAVEAIAKVPEYSALEYPKSENVVEVHDVTGIQDVIIHPEFATNRLIYITYNKPVGYEPAEKRWRTATVLAQAVLGKMKLENVRELLVGEPAIGTGGSRILFGPDGKLYVAVGALSTGDIDSAQRTDNIYGKILRINQDGSVPADNPFFKSPKVRQEIWTYGHRDPLGLAIDPRSGKIVASEHGPQGGDELNILLPGKNYGWPTYSFGTEYGGSAIPKLPVGPGTEAPAIAWLPAIAPAGIAFYNGDAFPAWKNNVFIASARRGQINGTGALVRVVFNDKLQEVRQEAFLDGLHQRFKDVRQGPDGLLYALTDEDDSVLLRISPAPGSTK